MTSLPDVDRLPVIALALACGLGTSSRRHARSNGAPSSLSTSPSAQRRDPAKAPRRLVATVL